ncbi:HET-domain-containing protein, partial [Lentinus tigrinus ALCF2SS1-6]
MWLLNTTSWTLHYFNTCTEVDYATLSHVWSKDGEQSFQDGATVETLHSPAYRKAVLRRLSPKIRDSCAVARLDGHLWLWIDTCCIDKTSSAELSEAINSMFTWYANSATCYAFLHDVSDVEEPFRSDSSLRQSEWFTRGWTLQELIAPQLVVFVSQEWRVLGTKHSMAEVVADVTGIEVDILMNTKSLDDISIARRMSWASRRKTTRLEDEAYSLMGIFGVHMPTIYGEGRDAFIRLQEEILKRSPDQSLFAWG